MIDPALPGHVRVRVTLDRFVSSGRGGELFARLDAERETGPYVWRPGTGVHKLFVMKHAGPNALDRLEPLLAELRTLPGLAEKNRGTFYRKSKAFLHFHEDPSGLFADIRVGEEFERCRVQTRSERSALLARVKSL